MRLKKQNPKKLKPSSQCLKFRLFAYVFTSLFMLSGCSALKSKNIPVDSGLKLNRAILEEQIARSDRGMEKVPKQSEGYYYFMLGELAFRNNSLEEALDYYEEAVEYEDQPATILRKRLAQIYLQKGELESASEELAAGLTEDTKDVEYFQLYGGLLASQKKYDEAVKMYRRVSTSSPKAFEYSLILIANTYEQKGDLGASLKTLSELVEKKPKSIFGYYYRARVYEALKKEKNAKADFQKAVKLGGSEAVKYDYARFLALSGEFTEARRVGDEVLAANPSNSKMRVLMGKILLRENKVEEALAEFEQVAETNGKDFNTRLKIAIIKLEKGDFVGAETELRLVLAEQPKHASARYYLGSALAGQKKDAASVDELLKIRKGESYYFESRMMASLILRQSGAVSEAAEVLEPALESESATVKHLGFLAGLQREAQDFSAAQETILRIIELEPESDRHYFTLGVFYDRGGKFSKAEKALEKAIALNPKNADALNYLGYALAERGRKLTKASEFIKSALRIDPKNGYYLDSLGWVYYKMGNIAAALVELKKAVKYVSDDAVILEHLAIVQRENGQRKDSLSTLEQAQGYVGNADDKEVGNRVAKMIGELKVELEQNSDNLFDSSAKGASQ